MIRPLRAALFLACLVGALLPSGSLAADFRPDQATLAAVPRHTLPALAVQKALDEAPRRDRPYRFAVPVDVALALEQGQWVAGIGDSRSWRLRLHSVGARSLSLHFPLIELPVGASLWVYDPRGELVHGPYGADRVTPTGLWIPLVAGEELVLEIRAPAAATARVRLGEARAFHGYRGWKAAEAEPKSAGSCNIDITCPEAAPWLTDAGAVARITIGNEFFCSGQLINNVRQDRRKLFLTAEHCDIEGSSGPADSVNFYFNYIGPCGDNQTEPAPAPTFQSAALLAHDIQSDFALLLITDSRPLPAGAFFAGWDASGQGARGGASLHHPDGDEKKISLFDTDAMQESANIGADCPIDAWRVQWQANGGTTEGGSSGGGLWNSFHRLIGVLSGGTASCANPAGFDYFGRLDRAWTANARSDGQLKAHLDPDGTCIAEIPGLDSADPNASPITNGRRRCEGEASACSRSGGGGGSGSATLVAGLLGALALRLGRPPRRL